MSNSGFYFKEEGKKKMVIDYLVLANEFQKLLSNAYMHVFVWVVIFDIVTGLAKSWFGKTSDSTKGLMGIVKHMLVVCLVLVAYPYLSILGFDTIATGFVLSFIAMYLISLAENWTQLGLPMPQYIKDHLEKLKEKNMPAVDYSDGQEGTESIWNKEK